MKNNMNYTKNRVSITVSAVLALSSTAAAPAAIHSRKDRSEAAEMSGFKVAMDASMVRMDHQMMSATMTGNPDHDFASMMIPHHSGAIDMARVELIYGKSPVLRRLAQEIIVTQEQEIVVMRRQIALLNRTKSTALHTMKMGIALPAPLNRSDSSFPVAEGMDPLLRTAGYESVIQPLFVSDDVNAAQVAISSRDRVYSADQTSNTVSVVDPSTNTLLGVIRLGDTVPNAIQPLYKGALLVHGLGFSPDHKTLAVVSIGSNSVTLIDTATNKVKGTVYVGRAPHEAFFTPNGKELWVAVRGEDYVSVIDPKRMKEVRRVHVANGPGMIMFSPDGKYAYIPSSFTPTLDVVDTQRYDVIAEIPQTSPFSPNLAVSPDGKQVWFTLKDTGKTQVISGLPPFKTIAVLNTGPISNHVNMVDNAHGHFAYITIGGLNEVKVLSRTAPFPLVAVIPTGDLPHGIWPSGDGNRVYVGLENGDGVQAIDTLNNKVAATIAVGQLPQAIVYVPDAVPSGPGTDNLVPLGASSEALHLTLVPPTGSESTARASVVVNSLGLVDNLQIAATGLTPGKSYQLSLVSSLTETNASRTTLANLKANPSGSAIAQALGPIRQVVDSNAKSAATGQIQFLVLTASDSNIPVAVQASHQ